MRPPCRWSDLRHVVRTVELPPRVDVGSFASWGISVSLACAYFSCLSNARHEKRGESSRLSEAHVAAWRKFWIGAAGLERCPTWRMKRSSAQAMPALWDLAKASYLSSLRSN